VSKTLTWPHYFTMRAHQTSLTPHFVLLKCLLPSQESE
jgi:hypothetical protein